MNQTVSESSTQQSLQISDNLANEEPTSDDNVPSSPPPPPISSRPERTKSIVIKKKKEYENIFFRYVIFNLSSIHGLSKK